MEQNDKVEWKGKSRGGSLGYLFFIWTIKYLGVRAAYVLLLFIVPYFIPFSPKSTHAIWLYSRKILSYGWLRATLMIFVSYYRFGQTLIDKVACGSGFVNQFKFEFDNYDNFLNQLNSGEGVVIIGAHVGSWEVGSSFFDDYGKKINVVMYDAEYQQIKEVIDKHSSSKNYKIIPLNEDPIASIVRIKSALDDKEYVCFQGDRYMNAEKLIESDFLGHSAKFPAGPFLVASRMKVPVVFYFAMREANRTYRFYFTVADPITRRKGVRPEMELFNQYKNALEDVVKVHPQQWFNYYKFWN